MADAKDTDRMAGDLLNALLGSLNKPVAGTGHTQPRPQVDESSMLDTIKGFLNQSLPGTKEREKPNAPAAPQGATAGYQASAAGNEMEIGGWEGLFRRQGREREAMHGRHERERTEMQQRHVQEMEAAMGGRSTSGAVNYGQSPGRDSGTFGPTRIPSSRGRRGPGSVDVPGL